MSYSKYPPDPLSAPNLLDWAKRLTDYLKQPPSISRQVEPAPVMLAPKISAPNLGQERATKDGVLLFNPISKNVEVSIDGQYVPVVSGNTYRSGSLNATSEVNTVSFGITFPSIPSVVATVNAVPGSSILHCIYITSITTTEFTLQLRAWNGTSFSNASANVTWIATV